MANWSMTLPHANGCMLLFLSLCFVWQKHCIKIDGFAFIRCCLLLKKLGHVCMAFRGSRFKRLACDLSPTGLSMAGPPPVQHPRPAETPLFSSIEPMGGLNAKLPRVHWRGPYRPIHGIFVCLYTDAHCIWLYSWRIDSLSG